MTLRFLDRLGAQFRLPAAPFDPHQGEAVRRHGRARQRTGGDAA